MQTPKIGSWHSQVYGVSLGNPRRPTACQNFDHFDSPTVGHSRFLALTLKIPRRLAERLCSLKVCVLEYGESKSYVWIRNTFGCLVLRDTPGFFASPSSVKGSSLSKALVCQLFPDTRASLTARYADGYLGQLTPCGFLTVAF